MKHFLAPLLLLSFPIALTAQSGEFGNQPGELLYPKPTMDRLHRIVDSLNIKFRACEVADTYRSIPQACGKYVFLSGEQASEAAKMLRDQPTFAQFMDRFPDAEVSEDLLVFKTREFDGEEPMFRYGAMTVGEQTAQAIYLTDDIAMNKPFEKRRWVWEHSEKSEWSKESVTAYYFETELKSEPLAPEYARLVQYVDCMVDTTTTKMLDDAQPGYYDGIDPDSLKMMTLSQKQALLNQLRSTEVMGFCSQDQGPRMHARDIAMLAAETVNWEVFLRAHLDIMNDRFSRMTDGSYAQARRKTYLHELEELDLNTSDLITGISLRIDNPHPNHYYGSVGRLGRAIAEAENVAELDATILRMLQDPKLDDFNRVIMHNLYLSYIYQDQNEARSKENETKFLEACKSLPPYLAKHVTVDQD